MADQPPLRVFVYGTLRPGERNFDRYCAGCRSQTARVRGRLYVLLGGYPQLVVPEQAVLARGTRDLAADLRTPFELAAPANEPATAENDDYRWITGDLLELPGGPARLEALDALEGFVPGGTGEYDRVCVVVLSDRPVVAWTYIAPHGRSMAGAASWGDEWRANQTS